MIDVHTHVIPGVDDGPRDMGGSVALAHSAALAGTRALVATPHVRDDFPKVRPEEVVERAREVNAAVRAQRIDLFVVPGGEVSAGAALTLSDDDLRCVTTAGNGRDLLLESPYGPLPSVFEEMIRGLQERGFRITLAHPEHNPTFQHEPARLERLVAAGVLLQITAASLVRTRRWRSRSHSLALTALRNRWAHVIASDSHSAEWRPPDLNPGLAAARRALPSASAELDWMVTDVPLALVQGAEIPARPAREPARVR